MLGAVPEVTTAVKSGTSDWDSLAVGYNPQYTVAIWTGYDDNRTLNAQDQAHAKKIFQNTFNGLYEGREGPWYLPGEQLEERRVDPVSGEPSEDGSVYWYLRSEE